MLRRWKDRNQVMISESFDVVVVVSVAVVEYLFCDVPVLDQVVFHVHLTACAVCFGVSAAYHALLCHSRGVADLWVRLDYVCISVLILASFVPGLYMGFYCEPWLLRGYLGMVGFGYFSWKLIIFVTDIVLRSFAWLH